MFAHLTICHGLHVVVSDVSIHLYLCGPPVAQGLQLLKLLWKGSAVGLSLTSALLQLYALSCPVLYAMANNFPLLYVCNEIFASSLSVNCWFNGCSCCKVGVKKVLSLLKPVITRCCFFITPNLWKTLALNPRRLNVSVTVWWSHSSHMWPVV